jgi:tetratricopeptide (TPR) repeat protein
VASRKGKPQGLGAPAQARIAQSKRALVQAMSRKASTAGVEPPQPVPAALDVAPVPPETIPEIATTVAEPAAPSRAPSAARRTPEQAAAARLFESGDFTGAAQAFAALAARADAACEDALNHAVSLKRAGDRPAAFAALDSALARWPLDPAPHVRRAQWAREDKDVAAAEASAREALRLDPNHRPAMELLADLLGAQGKANEALELRRRIVDRAGDGAAWTGYCAALNAADARSAAVAAGREAVARAPRAAPAWFALGAALEKLDRPDEALDCLSTALELQPGLEPARIHLVQVLATLGRPRAALARLDLFRAAGAPCNSVEWQIAEARAAFLAGDMQRGWEPYTARWTRAEAVWRDGGAPLWRGEDLAGKRVLVWAEQGAGDTIQFVRLLPRLKAAGAAEVILQAADDLAPWLAQARGADRVVTLADGVSADFQIPMIDIARYHKLSLADCAARGPYLEPPAGRAPPAPVREAGEDVFKVAISWAGNPNHPDDGRRSATAADFLGLAGLPGVRLFSVQRGGSTRTDFARERLAPMITDLSPYMSDWRDTAAAIGAMDAVVCVDTGPGHAAGAMGVPTFLLLNPQHDWRWQCGETVTPWYPNHRLIVQPKPGDWASCIAQAREGLRALQRARRAKRAAA